MERMNKTILLIAADSAAEVYSEVLMGEGYDVHVVEDEHQCRNALASRSFDLVISTNLNIVSGLPYEIVPVIRRARPHIPILVISGYHPEGYLEELIKKGADCTMKALHTVDQLREKVKELLRSTQHVQKDDANG